MGVDEAPSTAQPGYDPFEMLRVVNRSVPKIPISPPSPFLHSNISDKLFHESARELMSAKIVLT